MSASFGKRSTLDGAILEDCEVRWGNGDAIDLSGYLMTINAQRRILATLGLERRARDATPSITQYIAAKAAPVARGSQVAPESSDIADDEDGHSAPSYEAAE